MNRFSNTNRRPRLLPRALLTVAVFFLAAFLLVRGIGSVSTAANESQAESLKLAISRSAVHCYAMEGRYPESIQYLCDHYGIHWDTDQYVVDYEILGLNLMPSVTVIPLG